MKRAAELAPNSPTVHATLGLVYSNSSGNAYNPQKAEQELRAAIRLDPVFAYPHLVLASFYTYDQKQYQQAQKELNTYKNLAPPPIVGGQNVEVLQTAIDRGLKRAQQ